MEEGKRLSVGGQSCILPLKRVSEKGGQIGKPHISQFYGIYFFHVFHISENWMHISTIIGGILKTVFVKCKIMVCLMLSSNRDTKVQGSPRESHNSRENSGQVL